MNSTGIGSTPTTSAAISARVSARFTHSSFGRLVSSASSTVGSASPSSAMLLSSQALPGSAATPSRRRSLIPRCQASIRMPAIASAIAGTSGTNTSAGSTCSAVAARAVGPPHGVRFITPPARMVTQVRFNAFMPMRRYSGSIADTVIMYVVEPSPSSEIRNANAAVPTTIFIGSPLTRRRMRRTSGSNSPASIITPKYRIANISITPVGAIFLIPSSIMSLMPVPKPPASAKVIGTMIRATSGDSRLLMIRYMKVMTIPKPSAVSMGSSLGGAGKRAGTGDRGPGTRKSATSRSEALPTSVLRVPSPESRVPQIRSHTENAQ